MTSTDSAPPEPALQVAARLLAQGQPAEAAQRLGALVADAPTYAAAHVLRATALEAAGFVDEAIVSWGRAAALVPRSPLVHRERERLLATRLAEEPPNLPPAEPGPTRSHNEDTLEDADPDAPVTLDASDLVFADAPAPRSRATEDRTAPPDWAAVAPQAPILPPEGDRPASTPPVPTADEAGWGVLDEVDVPTPPPGTTAEPDVVAPEPPASPPMPTIADELDALITQLEDAPRIRPDPDYRGPEIALGAGDVDDMASETLAKIYAAQHQYVEAALVYEKMAARQPDRADALLERAAELRQRRP